MKKYQDIDLEIILFAPQDVITFSSLPTDSVADDDAMDDMYDSSWLGGLKK